MAKGLALLCAADTGTKVVTYTGTDALVDAAWSNVTTYHQFIDSDGNISTVIYGVNYSTATLDASNNVIGGTVSATSGSLIGVGQPAIGSVAYPVFGTSGLNNVPVNANTLIIDDPSGGYSITGLAFGRDGQQVNLVNATTQVMTVVNASASSSTGNKFTSLTGADLATTARGMVSAIYSEANGVWYAWLASA